MRMRERVTAVPTDQFPLCELLCRSLTPMAFGAMMRKMALVAVFLQLLCSQAALGAFSYRSLDPEEDLLKLHRIRQGVCDQIYR